MAYEVLAYIVMAYIVVAYEVMAYLVIACIHMARQGLIPRADPLRAALQRRTLRFDILDLVAILGIPGYDESWNKNLKDL